MGIFAPIPHKTKIDLLKNFKYIDDVINIKLFRKYFIYFIIIENNHSKPTKFRFQMEFKNINRSWFNIKEILE